MRRSQLARQLIAANKDTERRSLLAAHDHLADVDLAEEVRKICHTSWTVEPVKSQNAASVMRLLIRHDNSETVMAIEAWVRGISNITRSKFEPAVEALDEAAGLLNKIGRKYDAAQTQMAKLLSLGMLGRYEDAVVAGEKARTVFLQNGDELAAGKIEVNLSNIVSRNGGHRQAEKYCAAARKRFIKLGVKELQAVAENGLANTYSELNEFDKAERYYRMALETARSAGMRVTEAEIEASIGNLAQIRGRYGEALKSLELSRAKYDELSMPHQSAIADLEIANLYAELNLSTEAIAIYERVSEAFARLKMRAEEARSRLNYGRAAFNAGDLATAGKQLKRSSTLFELEKNISGQASAMLARARLSLENGRLVEAIETLGTAAPLIKRSENPRDAPAASWLEGEANLRAARYPAAAKKLQTTAAESHRLKVPELEQAAFNSLGKLAAETGDNASAEKHFKKAIALIERLRAPLASEEFSMSFLASRLEPYDQLARLYLRNGRIAEAFRTIENGRSRSLLDSMAREAQQTRNSDPRHAQLEQVRAELNSYYKRLDRAEPDEIDSLRQLVIDRETKLARLTRQIASLNLDQTSSNGKRGRRDILKDLHSKLGPDKTLVEFVVIDGVISAFVVGRGKISYIPGVAKTTEVAALLDDLHFQFGSMRYGAAFVERFRDEMRSRTDRCLESLYDLLIAPFKHLFTGGSIVFVPAGVLHYVPFHALRNDDGYLIERFEVSYAPSASVWSRLQEQNAVPVRKPLLMAFADERIPLVEQEVKKIKKILPTSKCVRGDSASFSAFVRHAPHHDLIHLACHGHFRPENPMFSSLHMADGWITVHDICSQSLKAGLVTLSACETGLSKVFAGDEILGLARGFLTAGAASLIVSLWTVNDAAAGKLMTDLYTFLQRGTAIASSLRDAQLAFIARGEHPYLWSPFVLIGRG